jgi:hypothetical protein
MNNNQPDALFIFSLLSYTSTRFGLTDNLEE